MATFHNVKTEEIVEVPDSLVTMIEQAAIKSTLKGAIVGIVAAVVITTIAPYVIENISASYQNHKKSKQAKS